MSPSVRRSEITILSFTVFCSVSGNTMKNFAAHRPEEMICSLGERPICFSLFHYLWLEAGGYFSRDNFSLLFLKPNWYFANKWRVSFPSPSKQMYPLDKIFTAVSSTAFVHTWRYNQHKMKFLWGALILSLQAEITKLKQNVPASVR